MKGRTISIQLRLREKVEVQGKRFRVEIEDTQTEQGDPEAFIFLSTEPKERAEMRTSIRVTPGNPLYQFEPIGGFITLYLPGSAEKTVLVSLIIEED